MKHQTLVGGLLVVLLGLTACGAGSTDTPMATGAATLAATQPAATEMTQAATLLASPSAEATLPDTPAQSATPGIPVTGESSLNVSRTATEYGPILVDDEGLSLYMFTEDTQNGESSNCNDECAALWPPLLTQGSPIAGEDVDTTLIGTVQRLDGSLQVTYNGWPLYRFHGDTTLGDTNGQGFEGLWYLVTPTGEAVSP